jgi:glycosyltransferase involved in cell wall biosynthesis
MENESSSFSIVMPAFNASQTIAQSVRSVQAQTEKNWELIIVDDKSSDATSEIVKDMQRNDARIRLIRNKTNQGVAASRNTALQASNGRYIAFLDSDDTWTDGKLRTQREQFSGGAKVVFGSYRRLYPDGSYQVVKARKKINLRTFTYYNPIGNLTGAYDRSLGIVLQKQIGHEDYLMWYEIVKRAEFACGTDQLLGNYRVNNTSLSGNKIKAAKWHWTVLRQEMKLSTGEATIGFVGYIAYSAMIRIASRKTIQEHES